MAAVLGIIVGVVAGIFVRTDVPVWLQPYLPIMVVAALDALLGAARFLLFPLFLTLVLQCCWFILERC